MIVEALDIVHVLAQLVEGLRSFPAPGDAYGPALKEAVRGFSRPV